MSWREAFIRQARSEQNLRLKLNSVLDVEYSHQLHYLQMITEKIAKAYGTPANSPNPPVPVHQGFVRLLQTLKSRPDIRQRLGYDDVRVFREFINSLLDLARKIELLAPSSAGMAQPNPEYPWRDAATGQVVAPVDFAFPLFDVRNPQMVKLESLLTELFSVFV